MDNDYYEAIQKDARENPKIPAFYVLFAEENAPRGNKVQVFVFVPEDAPRVLKMKYAFQQTAFKKTMSVYQNVIFTFASEIEDLVEPETQVHYEENQEIYVEPKKSTVKFDFSNSCREALEQFKLNKSEKIQMVPLN